MPRGYFSIGIYNPQKKINVGTLWRSALAFGASYIFTIGSSYKTQSSDTPKTYRHIPLFRFKDFDHFLETRPKDTLLIGVEIKEDARDLPKFVHPERAIYLLGSEGDGLPEKVIRTCNQVVRIPTKICLNVSTTGSIVMYDRMAKKWF